MNTLIVYASKSGTTEEAARVAEERLRGPCRLLDLRDKKAEIPVLGQYDAVIVGSPLYMGRPMKEVARFCREHETELTRGKPVLALFTCGMGDAAEGESCFRRCLPEAVTRAALIYRHLGGEVHEDRLNAFGRMAMREYQKQHGPGRGLELEKIGEICEAVDMGREENTK